MARLIPALCLALLLAACGRPAALHEERLLAFGTVIEVSLYGAAPEQIGPAMAALRSELERMHRDWHAWKPGALGDLNRGLAQGRTAETTPELAAMLARARTLSLLSGGLFNPAAGRLIRLWGFHRDDPENMPEPDAAELARLVQSAPSMADLVLEGRRARSSNPDLLLDLGAFAKGYGIDILIERLRERGIDNAIVNAGGDLRAIGRHGERPWRIGIRDPRGSGILGYVDVEGDQSVFTSGDYERYYERDGQRRHHIIDPRTGRPARGALSVTVLHGRGAVADAAATALLVAGPREWVAVARRMGVREVLLVDEQGELHASPAMAARLGFAEGAARRLDLSAPL